MSKNGHKKNEILKKLGIDKNLRTVQKGDQEALIQLLYSFKKGITDKLRTEITVRSTFSKLDGHFTFIAKHPAYLEINPANLESNLTNIDINSQR